MMIPLGSAESADTLGDDDLTRLEAELREEFYRVERAATPGAGTRPPALHESPELLKAFNRWNRVSTVARQRALQRSRDELR